MAVRFHPHANERMLERGTTESEVVLTLEHGEQFPAKFKRTGFRRNFVYNNEWRGKYYKNKQVEVYAVKENTDWLVITIITKYF
ncbi:transcriptional regulator [Candidatus Scalindua japonica]|uniref:Transcriptional regulator n=1 Tax=Candidatus Scalindua japonica TaxID=1284222 RepID=A0A286TZA5_9BACT|nr:DUF4258 domain-containing protein [Candidatus Scalindua japonica]GAX61198.1 transcriptional regulator [Candidatus Scalindua japonica]